MNQLDTVAIEIFNSIADGIGNTVDVLGYNLPTHGYFVGGDGPALVFESVQDANNSASLRKILTFVQEIPGRFIGWWADSETGKVYVDATTWYASHDDAMTSSRKRGEIAFWDIENVREIRTVR